MIIYHRNHLAGLTGAHQYLSDGIKNKIQFIGKKTAGTASVLISQNRSTFRMVQSRIFGRVN